MENNALFYALPFLKNISILYITVFVLYLGTAIKKSGMQGFNFLFWLSENKNRFMAGGAFILGLSALMAMTDVAPLFRVFGFDIDASPVGLGLALAVFLGFISTKQAGVNKVEKVKQIQQKATDIVQASTEIVAAAEKPKPKRKKAVKAAPKAIQ